MSSPEPLAAGRALSIGLAWVALACGGEHSLGGPARGEQAVGGIGLCAEGAELELIDDMEDGDQRIHPRNGRVGTWFLFNDESEGLQEPSSVTPFAMAELERARDGSRFAAWTRGSGFAEWGAGIGFDFSQQLPYDVSGFSGFAFWGRRAPDATAMLRADVTDSRTTPLGNGICNPETVCDPARECDPAAMACYDNFGVNVELAEDWQLYRYTWEELSQVGWSGNTYPEISRTAVYGMRFQTPAEAEFEFWIDDVAFICRER